ncbi:MAG: hypothetical protein J3R72DRAFT_71349 [Linnemannia gamsii]|nr:MAG: hypothetical protein J3R72DRAFT_71349 [Linnemannia gamsii]
MHPSTHSFMQPSVPSVQFRLQDHSNSAGLLATPYLSGLYKHQWNSRDLCVNVCVCTSFPFPYRRSWATWQSSWPGTREKNKKHATYTKRSASPIHLLSVLLQSVHIVVFSFCSPYSSSSSSFSFLSPLPCSLPSFPFPCPVSPFSPLPFPFFLFLLSLLLYIRHAVLFYSLLSSLSPRHGCIGSTNQQLLSIERQ